LWKTRKTRKTRQNPRQNPREKKTQSAAEAPKAVGLAAEGGRWGKQKC
jgi:hypothetical protein